MRPLAWSICTHTPLTAAPPLPLWIDQGSDDDHLGSKIRPDLFEATVATRIARGEIWINWHPRYDHSFYFVHSHIREHFVFHSEQSAR